MSKRHTAVGVIAAAGLSSGFVLAGDLPRVVDPQAEYQPLHYESVLNEYKAAGDVAPADWKQLNQEMSRLGGHMGHMDRSGESGENAAPPAGHNHSGHGRVPSAGSRPAGSGVGQEGHSSHGSLSRGEASGAPAMRPDQRRDGHSAHNHRQRPAAQQVKPSIDRAPAKSGPHSGHGTQPVKPAGGNSGHGGHGGHDHMGGMKHE